MAPAATSIALQGRYITDTNDRPLNAIRKANSDVLPGNMSNNTEGSLSNHEFIRDYLNGDISSPLIKQNALDALDGIIESGGIKEFIDDRPFNIQVNSHNGGFSPEPTLPDGRIYIQTYGAESPYGCNWTNEAGDYWIFRVGHQRQYGTYRFAVVWCPSSSENNTSQFDLLLTTPDSPEGVIKSVTVTNNGYGGSTCFAPFDLAGVVVSDGGGDAAYAVVD